ncbi:hypothetical protein SH501x_004797 [Pirellulaceae bacterium SH501]
MQPQLGAGASQHTGAGSQQLDFLQLNFESKALKWCLRAGLQQGSTSQQEGAASQQGAGAGAGAAQHGAGAGASQHGAGAGSQQLDFLQLSFESKPRRWCLRAGLQQGSTSQQVGAGSQQATGAGSQQTGAGSQQAFFLQKRPAEAVDEKLIATAATAKEAIKRRMDVSPNTNEGFIYRVRNTLVACRPGLHPVAIVLMVNDANS